MQRCQRALGNSAALSTKPMQASEVISWTPRGRLRCSGRHSAGLVFLSTLDDAEDLPVSSLTEIATSNETLRTSPLAALEHDAVE